MRAWLAVACLALGGCSWTGCSGTSGPPPTLAGLQQTAEAALARTQAAHRSGDAELAETAAQEAETAARQAAQLLAELASPTAEQSQARLRCESAARQARLEADRCRQEQELADLLSGWQAKSYRATRGVGVSGLMKGLALAARQADGADLEAQPPAVHDTARIAAELAEHHFGRQRRADGSLDWQAIAVDLETMGQQPPLELAETMALAYAVLGRSRLALFEIESLPSEPSSATTSSVTDSVAANPPPAGTEGRGTVPPRNTTDRPPPQGPQPSSEGTSIPRPVALIGEQRVRRHLLRGFIYAQNDLSHLAVREFEQLDEAVQLAGGSEQSEPELQAGLHLLLAAFYLQHDELQRADEELAFANRLNPNNPINVFLTGERLAADGRFEQAADSLETRAQGTEHEWLAQAIARRAREFRDQSGPPQPLLSDTTLMRRIALHYLAEVASKGKSEAAIRWQQSVDSARQLGERLQTRFPKLPWESESSPDDSAAPTSH